MTIVAIGVSAVMVMFITHELQYFFSIQHGLFPPPPMAAIAVMTAAVMRDCAVIVMFMIAIRLLQIFILLLKHL